VRRTTLSTLRRRQLPAPRATAVGAALAKDSTPITVWEDASPNANAWHFGTAQNGPEFGYERSGCCVYKPDVGIDDASGAVVIAWYSNVTNKAGLYTLQVSASGPVGSVQYVPGSASADRKSSLGQPRLLDRRQGSAIRQLGSGP
jgi:hypothetical protein